MLDNAINLVEHQPSMPFLLGGRCGGGRFYLKPAIDRVEVTNVVRINSTVVDLLLPLAPPTFQDRDRFDRWMGRLVDWLAGCLLARVERRRFGRIGMFTVNRKPGTQGRNASRSMSYFTDACHIDSRSKIRSPWYVLADL